MPLAGPRRAACAPWLSLSLTPGVGPVLARELVAHFGSPGAVLAAPVAGLADALGAPLADALLRRDAARDEAIERALAWSSVDGHHLITLDDDAYPPRLAHCVHAPPVLYVRGDLARLGAPSIAIVGSRHPTRAGTEDAAAFASALAEAGYAIVSGLARGIDAAAHAAALAHPAGTIAVLGHGPDRVYPASHESLAERIASCGAIVTEYPPGTPPTPWGFPQRNRIIAGLSLGVLVVEAGRESGALITARHAVDAGREVYAIPGSIHAPLHKGCHALLKAGAKLVESADDVLGELPASARVPNAARRAHAADPGDAAGAADPLLEAIGWDPVTIDRLAERAGAGAAEVAAQLLALELAGHVERLPNGEFVRLGRR